MPVAASMAAQAHAFENSVLGRTLSAGSFLFGVAKEVTHEVQTYRSGAAGPTGTERGDPSSGATAARR